MIRLANVHFSYNSGKPTAGFALRSVNLEINSGDFIGLIGPNGCGKSTLLRIIAGLHIPSEGTVELGSESYNGINNKTLARKIALVPQTFFSAYPFSVYEIVMMGRTPYLNLMGFEKKEDEKIVEEAIDLMGISHLKNKGINEISGGEAQRAFIARAIAQRPEVLLLDEPNAHLDLEHQISIFSLLKKMNDEQNLTVVAVTHDLNLVGLFSKRTVILREGRLVMDAPTASALTDEIIRNNFKVNSAVLLNKDNSLNVVIQPAEN